MPSIDDDSILPAFRNPGMSRGISWSKNGFITYVLKEPHSGHNLFMTYLENYDGQHWQLARPQGLLVKPLDDSAAPALHMVQWSNLSTDLAVFDEHGNFYILLAGVGLLSGKKNRSGGAANGATNGSADLAKNGDANGAAAPATNGNTNGHANGAAKPAAPDDDGPSYELTLYNHTEMIFRDIVPAGGAPDAHCVAFKWLGIEKPQIASKPAELAEGRTYTYAVHQQQVPWLSHPIATKQACVALRQNGTLNLYYQGEHKVEYHKLAASLAPDGNSGSVCFTHASIGFLADRRIIITAFDSASNTIYTYAVTIEWGFLVESATRQKQDPHFHTPKDAQRPPKLHCVLLHQMAPLADAAGDVYTPKAAVEVARLALIDVVSVSHRADSDVDILLSYDIFDGLCATTIHRYQVKDCADAIDSVFHMNNAAERGRLFTLVFQDKMTVDKRLMHICPCSADSLLLLIYTDGTIDMVDRADWLVCSASVAPGVKNEDLDLSEVTYPLRLRSLLDCGFRFPVPENPLMVSVSPNMACMVHAAPENGELTLEVLTHPNSSDTHLTGVGVAYTHAHACYANTSSDDLMVFLKSVLFLVDGEVRSKLVEHTLTESHRAISFQLNSFSKESVDKLLLNPPLQKLLSLQLVVSELNTQNRVVRDLAWVVLNLRSTSFGIMFSLSSIYRQISKKKPVEDNLNDSVSRAECIILLVGNVKWFIDLIVYLNQELLQLAFTRQRPQNSLVTVQNSVALPIVMSKVPRLFLMYALSLIGKTYEILKKLQKDLSESNKLFTPMKEALNRFFGACNTLPLNLNVFEGFLRDVDALVGKELASRTQNDTAAALRFEQQLFCHGIVPESFMGVANSIIDRHASSLNRDLKLSELYFYDNSWIDVGIATRNIPPTKGRSETHNATQIRLQYSPTEAVDALRKIVIPAASPIASGGVSAMGRGYVSTNKVRKCTRCRSVSLVADPLVFDAPSTIGLWTMVFQRTCICGSAWVNCS